MTNRVRPAPGCWCYTCTVRRTGGARQISMLTEQRFLIDVRNSVRNALDDLTVHLLARLREETT